ncbi:DNA replication factor Dna2-domain-containing protein [Dichotomocladium elegans]|nr:DNA replication factor Dna2-domain-containing protein [Dichotomocladium elegans]
MSHNAKQALPQTYFSKRQRLNSYDDRKGSRQQPTSDHNGAKLSPLAGDMESLDLEHFGNILLQPKQLQQRFLQKLNSITPNENLSPIAPTSAYNKQSEQQQPPHPAGPPACNNEEDMFSDISLDDLEHILAGTEQSLAKREEAAKCSMEATDSLDPVMTTTTTITSEAVAHADTKDDDMFDDFPDDLLDEALDLCDQVTPPNAETSRYQRFMVARIQDSQYDSVDQTNLYEKVLSLTTEDERFAIAKLRGNWVQTIVKVGDIVHIPGTTTPNYKHASNVMVIDDTQGCIIIHPDRLISCTAVAESSFCLRRSVLQHKIKTIGDYSVALVHGNIIHRIMQCALQSGDFSLHGLQTLAREVVAASLDELFCINQDEDTALTMLSTSIQAIHSFGKTFMGEKPKPHSRISTDMGANITATHGFETVAFSKILDVEEHLWSPTYGLKGMIDVSVEMKTHPTKRTITIPLELKTGKNTRFISHRAQTILYTLLMSDRYGAPIDTGALYYSRTNSLYITPALRNELQLLLMARNNLASAIHNRLTLPPMAKNLHYCQQCPLSDACLQHHKAVENGTAESSGLGGWFTRHTEHINDVSAKFYQHWLQLIDLEEDDIDYIRRDIWRQSAAAREKVGKCFANMVIDPTFERDDGSSVFRFCRHKDDSSRSKSVATNMLHATISVGDPVVVSSADGHINLGMGFVLKLDKSSVVVNLTSSRLRNVPRRRSDFHPENNQVFDNTQPTALFRIDRDEMSSGVSLMRRNMVSLLARAEDGGDEKRRRLIVELQRPLFETHVDLPAMPDSFNPSQRRAMEKVLTAKDYAIILGMPGTGKTTTTAQIICTLVERGKSVLLTSYTHSALDNVLHKVHKSGIDVLRLGNPEKVIPSLRNCMPNANPTLTSVERLDKFYSSKKVVGITCLAMCCCGSGSIIVLWMKHRKLLFRHVLGHYALQMYLCL